MRILIASVLSVMLMAGCTSTDSGTPPAVFSVQNPALAGPPPASSPVVTQVALTSSSNFPDKDGYAYVKSSERKHRTKDQIAALIEADNRSVLHVSARTICDQFAARLGRGAFESIAACGSWLRSSEVSTVACTSDELKQLYLARTDRRTGTLFDFTWHRDRCDPGEQFLVYQGQRFASSTCINLILQRTPTAAVPVSPQQPALASGRCPEGYKLVLHNWDYAKLGAYRAEAETLVAAARQRESSNQRSYRADDFSRTLGAKLRAASRSNSVGYSYARTQVSMSYFTGDAPSGTEPVVIRDAVSGQKVFALGTAVVGKNIRIVFDDGQVISPVQAKSTNLFELRVFWGEWGSSCVMNVHSLTS